MRSIQSKKHRIVRTGVTKRVPKATEYNSPRAHLYSLYICIWEDVIPRHCAMQRPVRCILYPQRTDSLIMGMEIDKTNKQKQALSKFSKILNHYHPVSTSVITEMSS